MSVHGESVSRCHAVLRCEHGGFFLEDANSKFGTLVEVTKSLQLTPHLPYCVQVGRAVLTILTRTPHRNMEEFTCGEELGTSGQETRAGGKTLVSGLLDVTLDEASFGRVANSTSHYKHCL